jgi:hypothetical protein
MPEQDNPANRAKLLTLFYCLQHHHRSPKMRTFAQMQLRKREWRQFERELEQAS